MNKINYRIILDAHKGGVQKVLRGFFAGDVASRRISVNLSAGGASFAFSDGMQAIMYVTKGNGVTNYGECEIVDNTVVYDVLQADTDVAGTVEMQLKVFNDDMVLYSPMFALEVQDAKNSDTEAETSPQFTALEEMLRKAQHVYDTRLISIELRDDLVFIATYADGSTYESNALTKALEKEIALITPMGDWNKDTTYHYLNLVNHDGVAWLCKEECKGEEPTDENQRYWQRHGATVDLEPIISGEVAVGRAKTVNGFSIYPTASMICYSRYIPEIVRNMLGNSMLVEKVTVDYLKEDNQLPSGAAMIEIIKPEVGKTKVTCMVGYSTQKVGIYLCDLDETNHKINGWISLGDGGDAETLDGYTVSEVGQSGARNLIRYPYVSNSGITSYGVTWVENGDGTVTGSGTNNGTGNSQRSMFLCRQRSETIPQIIKPGTYVLSGCPKGGSTSTYYLQAGGNDQDGNFLLFGNETGEGLVFTVDYETNFQVIAIVANGVTADNLTFKPMLELGKVSHDFVPFYSGGAENADKLDGYDSSDFLKTKSDGTVEYTSFNGFRVKRNTESASAIVGIAFQNSKLTVGVVGFKNGKLYRTDVTGTQASEVIDESNIANYALTSNGERKLSAPESRLLTLENTNDDIASIAFTGTNSNSGETFETLIQADRTGASIVPSGTNIAYRILHEGNFASSPVWVNDSTPPTTDHVWIDTSE